MMTDKSLIRKQGATAMVAAHDEALKLAEQGFKALAKAEHLLRVAFGEYNHSLWRNNLHTYGWSPNDVSRQMKETKELLKSQAWTGVLDKTGVETLMSSKRKEGLRRQIQDGEIPDFTIENVLAMCSGLGGEVITYMEEAVKEVFDWLRPRGWRRGKYKTNDDYQIGPKVIIEGMVECPWDRFRLYWHGREDNLHDLDRVFHLLDGQGIPKYPGDFVTAIRQAMDTQEDHAETKYFEAQWYKKGTMHITFKRLDLVAELNAVAGGKNLRPGKEAA